MKTTKNVFVENIQNPEQVFLLYKEKDELSLIADMELVDEDVNVNSIRTERMDFLLDNNCDFLQDVVECRGRYCGGISIYDNEKLSVDEVYSEFVSADERITVSYFILQNNAVKKICSFIVEGYNYVIIQ